MHGLAATSRVSSRSSAISNTYIESKCAVLLLYASALMFGSPSMDPLDVEITIGGSSFLEPFVPCLKKALSYAIAYTGSMTGYEWQQRS